MTVFIVNGPSMEPALYDSNGVLVNRILYSATDPKRGDIVVVKYPGDPEESYYVKRVVGVPGDKLDIKQGKVFINDQLLKESYVTGQPTYPDQSITIAADSYFTMGDNRSLSSDSRVWGVANKRFILGRVVMTLWPHLAAYPAIEY